MPLVNTKLPLEPLIAPANVSFAADKVKVFAANVTTPELLPTKLLIVAPDVVALISKVALSVTTLELAIEPLPLNANVPPLMVVLPV